VLESANFNALENEMKFKLYRLIELLVIMQYTIFAKPLKVIGRIKLTSWANSSQLSAKDSSVFFSDSNSLKATCIAGSHRSPLGCSVRLLKYTACLRQKFSQASTVLDRFCNNCVVSLLTRTIQSRDFLAFSSWPLAALNEERSLDGNKE
jgi:hypothetical protein